MRITDNALETGEFSRLSPDQRRLEMRALGEHADMLLVFRELTSDQFQVEVLDVSQRQHSRDVELQWRSARKSRKQPLESHRPRIPESRADRDPG